MDRSRLLFVIAKDLSAILRDWKFELDGDDSRERLAVRLSGVPVGGTFTRRPQEMAGHRLTDLQRLAVAVLLGDTTSIFPLMDEIKEQLDPNIAYVPRREAIEAARKDERERIVRYCLANPLKRSSTVANGIDRLEHCWY